MPWIFLLLALVCFGVTFSPNIPLVLTVILLLAALGFLLALVMSILAARMESSRRDDTKMINPDELRLMREQAAARKAALNKETEDN